MKHQQLRTDTSDVSTQNKSSSRFWQALQQAFHDNFPSRFKVECVIGSNCNEKLDLVDTEELVAYELKASPNNTHFEFYRDIFKVWVQRELAGEELEKLGLHTPEAGAKHLTKSFPKEVTALDDFRDVYAGVEHVHGDGETGLVLLLEFGDEAVPVRAVVDALDAVVDHLEQT